LDFHYVSPLVYPSESEARSVVGSVCKNMLTSMCRPTSIIGGKADISRTYQHVR